MYDSITITETSPPSGEALSLGEMKDHARVTHGVHDSILERCLRSATEALEGYCRRLFCDRMVTARFSVIDRNAARLPLGARSILAVRTYHDDGTLHLTVPSSDYRLIGDRCVFLSVPSFSPYSGLAIEYIAGLGSGDQVPQSIKSAIAQVAMKLYINESAEKDKLFRGEIERVVSEDIRLQVEPFRVVFL